MIAGEEKLVSIKQQHVTPRVAGDRNRDEILIELHGVAAANYALNSQALRAIVSVHDALALESIGKSLMVRHIIFVSKKHRAHAAHCINLLHELCRKPRRIDQDIPAFVFRPDNQITPRAETGFSVEATVINVFGNQLRKRVDTEVRVVMCNGPD